jgi:hypothetical protein
MNGFYTAYLTGKAGSGVALLAIKDSLIVGVDVGGMKYDGRIDPKPDDAGFSCHIEYVVPPGMPLITGPGPVAIATPVSITFDLPQNFAEGPVIGIQTPFGPLNVKFAKIRDIDL